MLQVAAAWLPLPPTSNNSYVNVAHGRAKSKALREWEEEAGWIWKANGSLPIVPLREKQAWGWSGVFYFPSHAKRDLDNHTKHVTDLIVRVVFQGRPDDRHMIWTQHEKRVDKSHPGVQVMVYEIVGEAYAAGATADRAGTALAPLPVVVPRARPHRRRGADGERAPVGPA